MIFNKKKRQRIKELRAAANESAQKLSSQKTQVNAVSSWLSKRKNINSFGEDFEYTLRPRGAK